MNGPVTEIARAAQDVAKATKEGIKATNAYNFTPTA